MSTNSDEKTNHADSDAIQHIQALREDVRQEVKLRIQQRDTYSIQMTIALGTIMGLATTATATLKLSETGGESSILSFAYRAMIVAPLIAIYYTTLILYSYRIHKLLAKYLREVIEPEIARLCRINVDLEWESWYSKNAVPGIRKTFFLGSLWIVTILSPLYVAFNEGAWDAEFMTPLGIITAVYLVAVVWITNHFWKG